MSRRSVSTLSPVTGPVPHTPVPHTPVPHTPVEPQSPYNTQYVLIESKNGKPYQPPAPKTVKAAVGQSVALIWVFTILTLVVGITMIVLEAIFKKEGGSGVSGTSNKPTSFILAGYRSTYGNPETNHPFSLKLTATRGGGNPDDRSAGPIYETITSEPGKIFAFEHQFHPEDTYKVEIVGAEEASACQITNASGTFKSSDIADLYLYCPLPPLDCTVIPSSIRFVANYPSIGKDMKVEIKYGNLAPIFTWYVLAVRQPITGLHPTQLFSLAVREGDRHSKTNPDITDPESKESLVITVPHNRYLYFTWFDGTHYVNVGPLNNKSPDVIPTPVLSDVKLDGCPDTKFTGTCVVADVTQFELKAYQEDVHGGDFLVGTGTIETDHSFTLIAQVPQPSVSHTYYVVCVDKTTGVDSPKSNEITAILAHG